jgi:hypothetical protein
MYYIQDEKNHRLQLKFQQRIPSETVGPLTYIIKQGIDEGVFNTKYPEEAARAYLGVQILVLQGINNLEPASPEFMRKIMATIDFFEKILGAKTGSILMIIRKNTGS